MGRIEKARELRRNQTEAEVLLWSAVRRKQIAGVTIRRQQPIGPFIVDFFCPAAKLIVELDGATHDNDTVHNYDMRRSDWLEARGYRVMRFSNSEVKRNLGGVVETIRLAVVDTPSPGLRPPSPSRGEGTCGGA